MPNASDFLAEMQSRSIRISVDGDALVVHPASRLTDADREFIRANKPGILAELSNVCPICRAHLSTGETDGWLWAGCSIAGGNHYAATWRPDAAHNRPSPYFEDSNSNDQRQAA